MKDVPPLSNPMQLFTSIGASDVYARNELDPRLFITYTIVPVHTARATSNQEPPIALFLIDLAFVKKCQKKKNYYLTIYQ